ncbi:MAG: hypothetical protein K6G55_07855 [Selenomonadaceae bacterium]|nr:hypothetical protein [Selenomonadaceae bacterium]
MASIKKETFGSKDGKEVFVWTLRNNKGNELKITDLGARVVSMRFRDKDFANKFLFKTFKDVGELDNTSGIVLVDGADDFAKIIWQVEQTDEGIKFSAEKDGKSAAVVYSLSNDNEISIKYECTGIEDISTKLTFSSEVLPDIDFRSCERVSQWEKITGEKIYSVTTPAEVMMEIGMFGYDPGCPIDYLNAGLKNAANLFCEAASIEMIVYATQNKIHAKEIDGGFAIKTSGSNPADGKIKSQTVYMLKNRK